MRPSAGAAHSSGSVASFAHLHSAPCTTGARPRSNRAAAKLPRRSAGAASRGACLRDTRTGAGLPYLKGLQNPPCAPKRELGNTRQKLKNAARHSPVLGDESAEGPLHVHAARGLAAARELVRPRKEEAGVSTEGTFHNPLEPHRREDRDRTEGRVVKTVSVDACKGSVKRGWWLGTGGWWLGFGQKPGVADSLAMRGQGGGAVAHRSSLRRGRSSATSSPLPWRALSGSRNSRALPHCCWAAAVTAAAAAAVAAAVVVVVVVVVRQHVLFHEGGAHGERCGPGVRC